VLLYLKCKFAALHDLISRNFTIDFENFVNIISMKQKLQLSQSELKSAIYHFQLNDLFRPHIVQVHAALNGVGLTYDVMYTYT